MRTPIVFLLLLLVVNHMQPFVDANENPFHESQTIGSLANLSGALADLDHDGDLDVYLSNYVGQHQVWFNDGQGFFTPGEFFGLSFTNELTVADFNGDTFLDVFHPSTGEVRSDGAEGIACWLIDTDYNEESFFVRHAYFLGANDPYKALKTTLKAEIGEDAWSTLHADTSRPFPRPTTERCD